MVILIYFSYFHLFLFRRLLCFETEVGMNVKHPATIVGDVFRALVPAFGDTENSVITPLLATGDQVGWRCSR